MSEAFDAIKECGIYMLLTLNGDYPAGRPFGSLQEINGEIYFNTTDNNQAHRQLREHKQIQIVAQKPGTFNWVRVTGLAEECSDPYVREKMLEYQGERRAAFEKMGLEHFLVFKFMPETVEKH